MMQKTKLLRCAKILRKKSTPAEKVLWQAIRNRQLKGLKFRRQYWVNNYIADFVCLEYKLIIELDGNIHIKRHEYNVFRTDILSILNFKVLRFWNYEVLNNLEKVLQKTAENTNV